MYLIDPVHLETFLKPNNTNKKSRGEVFTPPNLVNEMLDKMEEYNPGCFSNPNLKWMDNSCGIGNFLIIIFDRLMSGLSNVFPDPDIRKQHILKNMIYGVDICPLNISICKLIFGINGEENNLVCGDGLVDHFNLKMDCIVGNPPYQKENSSGDNKYYIEFTIKNIYFLKEKGCLLFLTPCNIIDYITCKNKNRNKVEKIYNIKLINIDNIERFFKVGSSFCYFVLIKDVYQQNTAVIYPERIINVDLKKSFDYLTFRYENIHKIIDKMNLFPKYSLIKPVYNIKNRKIERRIRKYHIDKNIVSKVPTEVYKYKIIDKIQKDKIIEYYYDIQMIDFDKPKVVIYKNGYLHSRYDTENSYSDNFLYILVKDEIEGLELVNFINSSKFKNFQKEVTKNMERYKVFESICIQKYSEKILEEQSK